MKGRLSLINGNKAYYTLGQISPEFKKVVVISTPLSEDKKTIKAENIGEYKILSDILLVDLSEIQKLKPFDYGNKLKVGSKVRYEQKNFEVAGIFKNSYAQLYIKSPILLQPFAIFNDISSALYSTLDDDQIMKNVNTNFRNGKYDADLLFRFIDSNNFKEKLYNVKSPPPFSSLQSIKLKKEVVINPSTYEGFVSNGSKLKVFFPKDGQPNIYAKNQSNTNDVNIDLGSDKATDFALPFTLYTRHKMSSGFIYNNNIISTQDDGDNDPMQKGLRPLNIGIPFDSQLITNYKTEIGNSFKIGQARRTLEVFGYYLPKSILEMISDTTFSELGSMEINNFFDIYINERSYGRPQFNTSSEPKFLYLLKENSKIGEYTFSSKLHLKDKISQEKYDKLLSFGDIVFLRKKPFYVLKYYTNSGQTYCLLLNEEIRGERIDTKTIFKKAFRIVDAEILYKNFKKDGINNFGLSSKFYSTKPDVNTESNQNKKNIITDLFLDNKTEQLEKLKEFNPNLFNSFLLATKLVDKKIEKGEVKVKKKTLQKSPYIVMSDNNESTDYMSLEDFVDLGYDINIKEGLFASYLDGSIYYNTPFKNKYNISDNVWKASCVAHFGTEDVRSNLNQFFDIKDIQDFITCMIFLDLIRLSVNINSSSNIDFEVQIYNEEFGFNSFNYSYYKRNSKFGDDNWRSKTYLRLPFGGRILGQKIYNLINDNGFFILFELAQNMFSISGLLQLAYINKEALIKKQKAKNYNNLFSKFNLNINFKSLKAFIEGDSVNVGDSPIDLVFRYPNQSDVTSNKLFAPQTKLELAEGIGYLETYDNAPPNDEYLGLREVNRNYGDFSTSNFTRLIRDLTQYLPDKFEYLVNFVYDYTVMGIREYEKIELIEETEQEGDLTSDIDNIFAETFEDEIDDIFADTF